MDDQGNQVDARPGAAERPQESGAAAPGRGGRMSRQRKTAASPEGNGCAERFIRTLKENLLWVRPFQTIEELRQVLLAFRETYNTTWLIERHGFLSPDEYRRRQLQPLAQAA
jgi:transposase InsO family protein